MRLRFKVQTIRTALWLGIGLGFLGIVYLLATMYMKGKKMWPYLESDDITAIVKAAKGSIKQETDDETASHESYGELWKLNVTGKVEASRSAETELEPVAPSIQPLTEVIEVVMVTAPLYVDVKYKDASGAAAAEGAPLSTDPQERHKTQVRDSHLVVGSMLRPPFDASPYEGKVLQITSDEVLFHWGGEEVGLRVAKLADVVSAAGRLPASPASTDEPKAELEPAVDDGVDRTASRELDEDGWYIGTTEQQRIKNEYDALLDEVSIGSQFVKDLRQHRIQLAAVPAESLAAQRGFEEGDVILSINGRDIVSKASAINYFKEAPDLQTYRIELDRKGKRITKTFKTR